MRSPFDLFICKLWPGGVFPGFSPSPWQPAHEEAVLCWTMPPFSGVVLAGGHSTRFQQDKARYGYNGKPLLQWVLDSFTGSAERFIVANRPYPEFGVPVFADIIPGRGALGGLHSALIHARFSWVAVAACDLPFLSYAFWSYLLSQREGTQAVVAADPEGRLEPLAALYHTSLLPLVERQLQRGGGALWHLLDHAEVRRVPKARLEAQFGHHLFLNANRVSDLPHHPTGVIHG